MEITGNLESPRHTASGSSKRAGLLRMAMGLDAFIATVLMLVLMLMVNYLSSRYYVRYDWSEAKYYALSDKSLGLLNALTNEVRVTMFFQPGHALYEDVSHLLKEYQAASDRIRIERVDPDRDLARTKELSARFQLDKSNVVAFESGNNRKVIAADDIMDYEYAPEQYRSSPRPVAFRGEQVFSSALQAVTMPRRPVAAFLQGHGERDPENFDRTEGYSNLARAMAQDNIDVRTLSLGVDKLSPGSPDALIIAGPEKIFSGAEIDLIRTFIAQNGRLIVLLDPLTRTGLEPLLEEWGVRLAKDVVVDSTRTLSGRELYVAEYGAHAVTRPLEKITTVFYLPRSVSPLAPDDAETKPDRPRVTVLASSTESGWAEYNMEQNPLQFDVGSDRPGPVPVAVAVEKGPSPGLDVEIPPTRMVLFGDSDFVANGGLVGGNVDFFMSALNWLLDRAPLMAIAPKPLAESRLLLDDKQVRMVFYMVVLFIPGVIGILGLLVWFKRRA